MVDPALENALKEAGDDLPELAPLIEAIISGEDETIDRVWARIVEAALNEA